MLVKWLLKTVNDLLNRKLGNIEYCIFVKTKEISLTQSFSKIQYTKRF